MTNPRFTALLCALLFLPVVAHADSVNELANDFWTWRATEQPLSSDDIVRIERPAAWVPDWSPQAVTAYRSKLAGIRNTLGEVAGHNCTDTPPGGLFPDRLVAGACPLGVGHDSGLGTQSHVLR